MMLQVVTLFVIFLLSIIMLYNLVLHNTKSYADNTNSYSPSFVRQEVGLPRSHPWGLIPTVIASGNLSAASWVEDKVLESITGITLAQIESVYYVSDGKMLNVTFRLTDPFEGAPIKHVPSYNIFVDADSDLSTGASGSGTDYRIRVLWDNTTKTWHKLVEELSPSGRSRVLDEDKNYNNFFNKNDSMPVTSVQSYYGNPCCYVSIPVDLHLFNYPKEYSLIFSTLDSSYIIDKNNIKTPLFLNDATRAVSIPPPRLSLSAEKKFVEIRAGDEKRIQLHLNSTSFLPSHTVLSINKIKGLNMTLIPDEVYLNPHGFSNSLLSIKSMTNTTRGPSTLSISAQSFFPVINERNKYSFQRENPGPLAKTYMAVTITDPPTFDEKFSAFWNVYGNALNLLAGGFLGGFSGYLFARMEKKKEKKTSS
jgi:hypothetical protein